MAKNYKLDFNTNTITLTRKFKAALANDDPMAWKELDKLKKTCTGMAILEKPKGHRTNKTQIKYKEMRKYIACLQNADKHMMMFDAVVEASHGQRDNYKLRAQLVL